MLNPNRASEEQHHIRNAKIITATVMVSILPTIALFAYFASTYNLPQLYISVASLGVTFFIDIYLLTLINRGRKDLAMMLLITSFIVNVMIVPFLVEGLGLIIALSIGLITLSVVGLTMTSRFSTPGVAVAIVFGALAFLVDNMIVMDRVNVPELEQYTPYIVAVIALPIVFVFIREFNRFTLQTKITLGILVTGGATVTVLIVFGLSRLEFIQTFLSDRYDASFTRRTESEILSNTNAQAEKIDTLFSETQNDLLTLAGYLSEIKDNSSQLSGSTYWNAAEKVLPFSSGQYGNSRADTASIFLPNNYSLTDEIIREMNSSIYLDFIAPNFLEAHREVVAVYYISKLGYTVYYPNISLAENVPPDFDPTTSSFFTIAEPANNPEKLPRWTNPYQDPAGAGLIVTVSIPVYDGGIFKGVISADIQLNRIAESIEDVKLGETGIPLLVDGSGLILAMTDEGYDLFGLERETVTINQNAQQTIFDSQSEDIQALALQIFNSDSGMSKFTINEAENYLSVNVLPTTGYKLVFIAPVNELNQEIIQLRTEIEAEIARTVQSVTLILVALIIAAFIVSLVVGQFITRPLKRLTGTVEQIAAGNLASRASVETGDESGVLARSFNIMADRLTDTLQGLEDRITERTKELETLSQNSVRRAALFESIARISRIISSTRNLERLLPQITETISSQLGYYHVGIFLVDVHREYAVLVATNSEGGQVMLARQHRLRIGETGIVGYATATGQPRIALDVGSDATFFNNPDLPDTHSEIALPLRSGSEIIGALDVQSKQINAFSEEDVNILSTLADQVSIAIQNARSFEQSLEALQRAERAAAQLSEQQWGQFLKNQSITGFHFDGVSTKQGKPNQRLAPNNLAIPIVLRGVQIGTLRLSTPDPDRKWDDNEIAMAQATAERTALAIETARLLQDAQKRVAKERAIGQISTKIGNLVNIDNIVQTTIQELGETLRGTDIAIQFASGSPEKDA